MAYQTRFDLNGLDNQQFFMLVSEAAKNLGWTIQVVNENMMQLTTFKSAFSWGETVRVQIENETVFAESRFSRKQLSGNSRNRKNIEALTNQIELLRSQYSPSQLTELYQQQVAKEEAYAAGLAKRLEENNLTVSEKISLGVGGHYVTYTVIGINFAVFIIMIISGVDAMQPTVESLIKWGGNLRSSAVNGEWYRLFTNIFLHAGIIHLLFNMYALYYIGMFLEPMLSRWRFLALYISTGVIASATSIWWSGDRVSVGASGAIFGMYGVFLALLTTNLIEKESRSRMLQSIGIFVVYNLLYGMKGGIDNSAHAGGLISGFILGYVIYYFFLRKEDNIKKSIAASLVIALLGAAALLSGIRDDTVKFEKDFERFGELEEKALSPLRTLTDSSSPDLIVQQLSGVSMPAWQQSKKIFDSASNYHLNNFLQERIKLMRNYVDLRIEQTELMIKDAKGDSTDYAAQRETVDKKINDILESLKNQ